MAARRKPGAKGKPAATAARRHSRSQNVTTAAEEAEQTERVLRERQELRERLGLDDLDELDRAILQVVLQRPGTTDTEIGILVGVARETVNRRKNRPLFRKALDEAQLDALTIIQRNQAAAARKLGQLVTSTDPRLAFSAASLHVAPLLRQAAKQGTEDAGQTLANFLANAAAWRKQQTPAAAGATVPASGEHDGEDETDTEGAGEATPGQ